jgi:hypothetical protein
MRKATLARLLARRVDNIFLSDVEVRFQQAPWYFDPGHDWWDPPPAQAIAYLTRLFEHPEPALEGFADRRSLKA